MDDDGLNLPVITNDNDGINSRVQEQMNEISLVFGHPIALLCQRVPGMHWVFYMLNIYGS